MKWGEFDSDVLSTSGWHNCLAIVLRLKERLMLLMIFFEKCISKSVSASHKSFKKLISLQNPEQVNDIIEVMRESFYSKTCIASPIKLVTTHFSRVPNYYDVFLNLALPSAFVGCVDYFPPIEDFCTWVRFVVGMMRLNCECFKKYIVLSNCLSMFVTHSSKSEQDTRYYNWWHDL